MSKLLSRITKLEQRLKGLSFYEKTRKLIKQDEPWGIKAYMDIEDRIYDFDFMEKKTDIGHQRTLTYQDWVRYLWNKFHFDVSNDLAVARGKYGYFEKLRKELFAKRRVFTSWK